MKTEFPSSGRQLFVGEGDFSLTLSLLRQEVLPDSAVVTCFSQQLTDAAAENARYLRESGICVISGVDATNLQKSAHLNNWHHFDFIVFNFPHTGHKMKIHKCRQLLRDFFISAAPLLSPVGQIWVTLCAGQGGTPYDTVSRDWGDTWQLTCQAAAAGLILTMVRHFEPSDFQEYNPTGNRGRESRTFHTRRGVTHIMERSSAHFPAGIEELASRVNMDGVHWSMDAPSGRLDSSACFSLPHYWCWRLGEMVKGGDGEFSRANMLYSAAVYRILQLFYDRKCISSEGGNSNQHVAPMRCFYLKSCGRYYRLPDDVIDNPYDVILTPLSGQAISSADDVIIDEAVLEDVMGRDDVWSECCVYVCDDDCSVSQKMTHAPLKCRLITAGSCRTAENVLRQLLSCRQLEDAGLRKISGHEANGGLVVKCADTGVSVLESHGVSDTASEYTVWNMEMTAVCWAHLSRTDWRQAVRYDFYLAHGGDSPVMRCLCAPLYRLDLSFWLPSESCQSMAVDNLPQRHLWRAFRALLRHLLVSLDVIDEYTQPQTQRQAVTIRLVYQQLETAPSWQLIRQLHVQWLPQVLSEMLALSTR